MTAGLILVNFIIIFLTSQEKVNPNRNGRVQISKWPLFILEYAPGPGGDEIKGIWPVSNRKRLTGWQAEWSQT